MRPAAVLRWLTCALFAWALVRSAWLCDDVFITLRTVDNLVNGHGLRWNVADRVNINTHPLWMFLLGGVYAITGHAHHGTLALCIVCSSAAVALVAFAVARKAWAGAVGVAVLASSRGFTDFSTAGLENPMTHLLLVGVVLVVLRGTRRVDPLPVLGLLAALMVLNRVDTMFLVLPALLSACRGRSAGGIARAAVPGLVPLVPWCVFAVLYFGSLFPVVAHAKAFDTGIPAGTRLMQGLEYFLHALRHDPVTVAALIVGLAVGLARPGRGRPLAVGGVLYLLYVGWIGGSYMAGRFFAAPLLVAVCLLLDRPPAPRRAPPGLTAMVLIVATLGVSLVGWKPSWWTSPDYARPSSGGIIDERGFWSPVLGLLAPRPLQRPESGRLASSFPGAAPERPGFVVEEAVGVLGFELGPGVHLADRILCDPLCARLPALHPERFQPGHIERRFPEGYLETLASGENRIRHPAVRALWDDLALVHRAPLFAEGRLAAMWRLWTGAHDEGIAAFVRGEYRDPPLVVVPAGSLAEPVPEGTPWWRGPLRVVSEGGLEVRFDAPRTGRRLRVGLDSWDVYRLEFVRGGRPAGSVRIDTRGEGAAVLQIVPSDPAGGSPTRRIDLDPSALRIVDVDVPAEVESFDALRIHALRTRDAVAAVGFVR